MRGAEAGWGAAVALPLVLDWEPRVGLALPALREAAYLGGTPAAVVPGVTRPGGPTATTVTAPLAIRCCLCVRGDQLERKHSRCGGIAMGRAPCSPGAGLDQPSMHDKSPKPSKRRGCAMTLL